MAWYGRLVGAPSAENPAHPVQLTGKLHGAMLGLYGGQDPGIPLDTVEQMKKALAAAARQPAGRVHGLCRFHRHAFHADYRSSYRKDAAEDGWKRCQAWFKAQGVI